MGLRNLLSFILLVFISNACCSIVIPPVTLTGSKTAVERQIIGEENELEEDVWMISSAKTTSEVEIQTSDENKQTLKREENRQIYRAFVLLDVFSPRLRELKEKHVVGENNEGFVEPIVSVPGVQLEGLVKERYNPELASDPDRGEYYRNLEETVKMINKARRLLIEGYITRKKQSDSSFKATEAYRKELYKLQKQKYHSSTLKGEYIQTDSGKWVRK